MGYLFAQTKTIQTGLPLLLALILVAAPAGAEGTTVETLVAELTPKAAGPGFSDLAISSARGLGNLDASVTLLSELLEISTKAEDSKELYVELASIQELLGRYEEASQSWESAAAAQPGKGDPSWLLSAAACRLAIGDAGTATALAKAALLTTARPGLISLAMLIESRAMILNGDMPGALTRSLEALAVESSGLDAAALSIARDASGGAERAVYEKRLREEHPGWPETQDALGAIYGLKNSVLIQSVVAGIPGRVTIEAPVLTPVRQAEAAPVTESKPLYYQLGAFRDEANAVLLTSRLVRAGFKPETARRDSRAGVLSVVYLEAGPDPARLMIALKDAGFESWPLFTAP
jgi:tetratricopeptide (TPR) repeat protein